MQSCLDLEMHEVLDRSQLRWYFHEAKEEKTIVNEELYEWCEARSVRDAVLQPARVPRLQWVSEHQPLAPSRR
jgi:hypothetical protein